MSVVKVDIKTSPVWRRELDDPNPETYQEMPNWLPATVKYATENGTVLVTEAERAALAKIQSECDRFDRIVATTSARSQPRNPMSLAHCRPGRNKTTQGFKWACAGTVFATR